MDRLFKKYLIVLLVVTCFLIISANLEAGQTNNRIGKVTINKAFNYPNPFNNDSGGITTIRITPEYDDTISIDVNIYILISDETGKRVWSYKALNTTLKNNKSGIAKDFIAWSGVNDDGKKVSNGVYDCKVIIESSSVETKRFKIVVK